MTSSLVHEDMENQCIIYGKEYFDHLVECWNQEGSKSCLNLVAEMMRMISVGTWEGWTPRDFPVSS